MIQRIYRTLFLLFLIAGSIRTFAQAPRHEIGIWLVDSELTETTLLDDDDDDITVDFDPADELEEDSIDVESEITWTAAAGANIRLTEHLAIGGEIKYVPWSAVEDGANDDDDPIDVDPITFSAGLKLRF